jgi:hypothetical protein
MEPLEAINMDLYKKDDNDDYGWFYDNQPLKTLKDVQRPNLSQVAFATQCLGQLASTCQQSPEILNSTLLLCEYCQGINNLYGV